MKIEQLYTGCLAEAAYYIESDGEVAIIDPLRDVNIYIDLAKKNNAQIKYIFETHFHADFVSGHVDLANKTGATIVYGPTTLKTGFDALIAEDNEIFKLGKIKIKLLHTPGHTMESSCFLVMDEIGKEKAIFTGDTLFIGDVGRPDLAQKVIAELTQEKLAAHLYDSLRNKIMPLSNDLIVYPGHGAGSACGKNMSKETSDTLGHQKETNYALRKDMSKHEFIAEVLSGLMPPPGYFPKNVLLNLGGYENIDSIIIRGTRSLNPIEFEVLSEENKAIIIDTRDAQDFSKSFIPGALNIGLNGSYAVWAGTLIPDLKQAILIVADKDKEEEAVIRLARVGFGNIMGFLNGGMEVWKRAGKEVDSIESISLDKFEELLSMKEISVMDVRKASEYQSEHLIGAINLPLDYINDHLSSVDKNKTYYVHCAAGYRSMIFVSLLRSKGYHNLINILGGFDEIKRSGNFRISEYVCPKTML